LGVWGTVYQGDCKLRTSKGGDQVVSVLENSVPELESRNIKPPSFWFRNRISKFLGGFYPVGDGILHIGKCCFLRNAMRRATGKLRHVGDESLILVAPKNNCLVTI